MVKNTNPQPHIDSEDLSCPVCYVPFETRETQPITAHCGHTFCSTCFQKLEKCALCQTKLQYKHLFQKSILLSSLLENISQVKKCAIHQKWCEGLWSEKKKFVCFDCLADKLKIIRIQGIEQKIDHIREIMQKMEECSLFGVEKFLESEQENLKKRVDNLLCEEFYYARLLKERLHKEIQEKIRFENEDFQSEVSKKNLMEWLKMRKSVLEKWRDSHKDDYFVIEILEKSDGDNLLKMFSDLAEKQTQFLAEIKNNQKLINCLSKKLKEAFKISSERTLEAIPEDLEIKYLTEIFEQCSKGEFNPLFFDFRMEHIEWEFFDLLHSGPGINWILENMSNLETLTFSFEKISELGFPSFSNLLSKLKNLKEFSLEINQDNPYGSSLSKFRDHLRAQEWFSRFNIRLMDGVILLRLKDNLIN